MELITATECVNRLRQSGAFKGKLPYFIQLVNNGVIPYHDKAGSSKRWYVYEQAKAAIKGVEDPTRDAQREANEKKRYVKPSNENLADMSDEEREAYDEAIAAIEDAKAAGLTVPQEMDVVSVNGVTLSEAKVLKEYWLGKKAELDYKKMSGEVIENREVERQAFETARAVRDAILAIPIRISSILAAQNDPQAIKNILTNELTSALLNLSNKS